ncbi:MAG: 1-acyl-sn-glycerol-3-phosphate acyltransferase [Clostridia bacterium]|nr:1-acyl-sn-glycerol-3-phosphate acyltransferase [Clostridia bacterium]
MKRDLHKEFKFRKIKKPSKFVAKIAQFILKIICKKRGVTFEYDADYERYKKEPIVLLSQHASKDDYIYVFAGTNRQDTHIVCGYQNIFNKGIYGLLKKLGVIAKYLYQPDVTATKQMLEAVKNGGSLAIFPEGIQSTSGSNHPINPATVALLKKLKLPVILTTLKGSYFTRTRYSTDVKKGKITVAFNTLFTKEDLQTLSVEELNTKLLERFSYNEFDAHKGDKTEFIGKKPNIYGLDNIIYKCPHCNSEFKFKVEGSNMLCQNCNFEITMNNRYEISSLNKELPFENIDKWYKWQRKVISNEVKSDNFILNTTVNLCTLNTEKLDNNLSKKQIGEGEITLTNKGLTYKGTKNGEQVTMFFDAKNVYSLTIMLKYGLDLYYKNEYYYFKLTKNEKHMTKWMLASEEIHNLYDEEWRKASEMVYEYES